MILDELCNNATAGEDRIKEFCKPVNSVVSHVGGKVSSDKVWMKTVDTQLIPVLSYGSHLWNIDPASIATTVDAAYRKGIRRGFGMRSRESIHERLKECYIEASEKIKRLQLLFMEQAIHSVNYLVQELSWLLCRRSSEYLFSGIETKMLFVFSYRDLREFHEFS